MIPENAGGGMRPCHYHHLQMFAIQMTCHTDEKQRQWHQNQLQESVISNFGTELEFMCSQSQPAANTATELAFAIRLRLGPMLPEFYPNQHRGLPEQVPILLAPSPKLMRSDYHSSYHPLLREGFSKYKTNRNSNCKLTIIEIIATTKPVDTESP